MHRVDCRTLLGQDSPDAWVLAVLADFNGLPPRAIVHEIITRLLQRLNKEPPRLREYVGMLEILASNRDFNLNIQEELDMLTIDFEKLPTYQMGMKKGMQKGLEQGIKKGRQEGREKGSHDQALAIAARLLAKGMAPTEIASLVDLELAEVEAIKTPT